MTIEDDKGNKYYLVEVIALMLNQIKTSLVDQLSRTTRKLKATDFNWVITVPAIWKGRGKQLMREAAYKVCIVLLYYNYYEATSRVVYCDTYYIEIAGFYHKTSTYSLLVFLDILSSL